MVAVEDEHMILLAAGDEKGAKERALEQIENMAEFGSDQFLIGFIPLGLAESAQVGDRKFKPYALAHQEGVSVRRKPAAEGLVPIDQIQQSRIERVAIQLALQKNRDRMIVAQRCERVTECGAKDLLLRGSARDLCLGPQEHTEIDFFIHCAEEGWSFPCDFGDGRHNLSHCFART